MTGYHGHQAANATTLWKDDSGRLTARWGESPVAFLTLRNGADATEEELKAWVNSRVGSIQRVIRLMAVPRWWWSKKLKSYFMRQFSRTAGFGAPVRRASGVYSSIL